MQIKYDNVFYFGKDKKNLHFINLVIDNKSYGDLVIGINSDLGAQLNNYCLEKEQAIEVELVGSDLDTLELSSNDLVKSVTSSVYDFFDTTAELKGFKDSADCILSGNSTDTLKAKNAKIFSEWRDKNLSIFNEIIKNVPDNFSIDYVLEHFIPIEWAKSDSEKTLDELKEDKLDELTAITSKFDNQLVNNEMIVESSLGLSINADLRSQNNIRGLISVGLEPVDFVDSENVSHSLSIEQLNTLLNECALNGQNLYLQKWAYKSQIEQAQTVEELNKIVFKFEMKDFSK